MVFIVELNIITLTIDLINLIISLIYYTVIYYIDEVNLFHVFYTNLDGINIHTDSLIKIKIHLVYDYVDDKIYDKN